MVSSSITATLFSLYQVFVTFSNIETWVGGIFYRLCTIQSENVVIKSEHAQTVSQLTAQNEALRNSFRDQVRHLQEEHRKTVETLQQQLSKVETQLFQLQSEPSTKSKQ